MIAASIGGVFLGRASCIFTILFGISFYIILRKPDYGSGKFVWRCFLLMLIGLCVKVFYWPDALMWYGICGMVLVLFRNMSTKSIVISIIILYLLSYFVSLLKLGNVIYPQVKDLSQIRYGQDATWSTALAMWPNAVEWYLNHVLNGGVFYTLANFAIGYLIGRLGWVETMDVRVNAKVVIYCFFIYLLFLAWAYLPKFVEYPMMDYLHFWARSGRRLSGAFFYATALIWVYNHTRLRHALSFFESYGRMGLTNYMMQSIIGVVVMCHLGVAFLHLRFAYIICGMFIFYLLQAIFSRYWLLRFKNGPMEYLWRCATEREWLPLKKASAK